MLDKGLNEEALVRLKGSPPSAFATCELTARRDMLQATAYFRIVQDGAAQKSMEEAESACPQADPLLQADLATRRGVILDDAGTAEKDYRIALRIAREQPDSFREAGALLNLANATQNEEHYDESIELGRDSLEISKRNGYRLYEEKAEGNLGWDYYKIGDFDKALTLFEEAEQAARSLGSGPDQMRWLEDLGLVHEQDGELESAGPEYREALALAKREKDKYQSAIASGELALVSIRIGEWAHARELAEQTIQLAREEQDHPLELKGLFAEGLIASGHGDRTEAENLLSKVAQDPGHDRQSLRWEAQAALADLYAKEEKRSAAEAEYRTALNTVRQARCSIQHEDLRMPFFANATRVYNSYIDFLVQQGKTTEALKTADESRALTLAEGLGIGGSKCLASEAAFHPQRAAKKARANILFYWLGVDHSYLWVVASDRVKLYPLPPAPQIDTAVQAYRRALVGSRDVLESGDASGAMLYQALIAPAAAFFRPGERVGERVIVISDGSLSGLNFETLIAPNPKPHYWIEDVAVENASSIRLLAASSGPPPGRPARRSRAPGKLLLMGNPVPPREGGFEPLPNAAKEMKSVARNFSPASEQIYEQRDSTPDAYMNGHPEQFAYIHFVAHGMASMTDPLDSAVVLSPAAQPGSSGGYKLYARDVIAHPLDAELVTVSTCKGAGVRSYTGEGLVGLSWAFLHAGAHHVIGALWDVSDESTPLLMAAMYAELVKGAPPHVALRTAKLSLLHSGAPFRKPYYWAPFQLYTGS